MPGPEIAFDITPLQNSHQYRGIGTYVRGLARRLAEQDEIPIEFWGWEGDPPLTPAPPHTTLVLPRMPMPAYRGAWLFAQLAMRRRAGRSKVRVVHITDPDALTTLRSKTLLTTVYDVIPLQQGIGRRRLIARAGYSSYLRSLGAAELVFAISEQTANDLVRLLQVPPARIRVARPGVDLPPSSGLAEKSSVPYFLYIGGPNPNKNLSVLIDALAQCSDLHEELRIGGHWLPKQTAALQTQVAENGLRGRVRFVGFVPDHELADLMRDATALVVPSLFEGFGLPVAEGLAAGALVVHSRLPVLEETSAGAALTFDARSPAELAACLRTAALDAELSRRLRHQGLVRATRLRWDDALEATLAGYRDVLRQ